jgi:hypothetical protein
MSENPRARARLEILRSDGAIVAVCRVLNSRAPPVSSEDARAEIRRLLTVFRSCEENEASDAIREAIYDEYAFELAAQVEFSKAQLEALYRAFPPERIMALTAKDRSELASVREAHRRLTAATLTEKDKLEWW